MPARGRKGHGFSTPAGGVQVVEAPGAYSSAQTVKAKRPKPKRAPVSSDGDRPDRGDEGGGAGRKRPRAPSWERDYQQIWKAVTDLGAEQFTGKEKKAYEARKIVERGGRAPKDPRMPYVMLQGLRKKAKQREEQREAMEAEAGVVTGNAGSARRKSAQTSRGGRRAGGGGGGGRGGGGGSDRGSGGSSFGPAPSMGMMKSGVLHISRNTAPPGVRKRMSQSDRAGGGRGGGGGARKGKGAGGRGGR